MTVLYDGEVRDGVLVTSDSNPLDNRPPIPDGWMNSTDIYELAYPECGSGGFGQAYLNMAHPDWGDGEPVWWLLNTNPNVFVRWDGAVVDSPWTEDDG